MEWSFEAASRTDSRMKGLAGKRAGVNFGIGTLTETINAGGSPRDLETILQLIYLKATAPRRDEAAFNALRAQYAAPANRDKDPDWRSRTRSDTMGRITRAQPSPRLCSGVAL
jgi:zinc protease